jgi:metal-sulfur cluster biosynthetic enzyme
MSPTAETVRAALADVFDPEAEISILDMGLVYEIAADDTGIRVRMTLTHPSCPAGDMLMGMVRDALDAMAEGLSVELELTFDPPWTPDRITPEGRRQLAF